MKYTLIILFSILIGAEFFVRSATAQDGYIPQDNDSTYTLPTYIPRAARPSNPGRIIFEDDQSNDALYLSPNQGVAPTQPQAQPQTIPQPVPTQPQLAPAPPQDYDSFYQIPQGYNYQPPQVNPGFPPVQNYQPPQWQQQQPQQYYQYQDPYGGYYDQNNLDSPDAYPNYYY